MRTSLVLKILIPLCFCFALLLNQKVNAMGFPMKENSLLSDTIDIPIPSDDFLPDTLSPQAPTEQLDTLARQSGSGMILDQKVDYSAKDSIRFDIRKQIVHLYGDADLKYGEINLKAAYVSIDFNQKELFAKGMPDSTGTLAGNPVFQEASQSFESRELRYNFETKKGRTVNVITEEADGYLHGDVVKIMNNQEVHVLFGKYTTCDNPDPHFHISFARAKILPNDKIITTAPRLTIMGVRTPLMLPFGFFPNTRERASGILIPSYGETRNRGFYLQNGGFYWGINDYFDLSLTGDIYSRGSWATAMGSNYKVMYKYSGRLNLNYAVNILGERNLPGYEKQNDFRITWSHSQDPKARPNSVFRASVNAGTSQSNRFNPMSRQDYLSNTFASNISYSHSWEGGYNLSLNARHSQNTLNRSVTLSLPEIAFSKSRFYPLRRRNPEGPLRWYEDITMNYNANATNQVTAKEEEMFTPAMFNNLRNGVQHTIPINHSFRVLNHFNLTNSFNYNERWYFQKIERSWQRTEPTTTTRSLTGSSDWDDSDLSWEVGQTPVIIPGTLVNDTIRGFYAVRDFNYSTSLGTQIFGLVQFKRGPVHAVRHELKPNVSFSIRPDFADPFWGYYQYYDNPNFADPVRYSPFEGAQYGVPSAGRSGQLSFNLSNQLQMKVRNRKDTIKGERKISLFDNLSVNGSYDVARDSLNFSDIRIAGRTRLFEQIDVSYTSSWTPYATDSLGRSVNRFLWENDRKLLAMRNSSWSFNFNYTFSSKNKVKGGPARPIQPTQPGELYPDENLMEEETDDLPTTLPGIIDYSVPWSLRFSYSFSYNNAYNFRNMRPDRKYLQNLTFQGDFNLTTNWRVGFSSGYNFENKQFTYTALDIYRDLHCWELSINWIPFGFMQSYNMTLRVKSSVLQDLKYNRRTHHLDRAFR